MNNIIYNYTYFRNSYRQRGSRHLGGNYETEDQERGQQMKIQTQKAKENG